MIYRVTYRNPNDVTRAERVETFTSVAGVNAIKRRAEQYPGSCVLIGVEKISAKVAREAAAAGQCPLCGGPVGDHPATSRADDVTAICSRCGVAEALGAWRRAR